MRKKLLGLLVLLGAHGAHAMQQDQRGEQAQNQPEPDLYARVLSEQNKRYLATLGYTEQEMEDAVRTAQFIAQERTKPLLTFCQEEKAALANAGKQDKEIQSWVRNTQDMRTLTHGMVVKLQKMEKWNKRVLRCQSCATIVLLPAFIMLLRELFSCTPA